MKKILLLAATLCIAATTALPAQAGQAPKKGKGSLVDQFLKQYRGTDSSLTTIRIGRTMLKLVAGMAGDEEELDMLKKLRCIHLVSKENIKPAEHRHLTALVDRLTQANGYEVLMTIDEGDASEKVTMLVKHSGETQKIEGFAMTVIEKTEFVLIHIVGEIDLKTLGSLQGSMKINGLEHLDKIDEKAEGKKN